MTVMRRVMPFGLPLVCFGVLVMCAQPRVVERRAIPVSYGGATEFYEPGYAVQGRVVSPPVVSVPRVAGDLGVNLRRDLIAANRNGRLTWRTMQPQYITIHSTANPSADAADHAKALKNGALRASSPHNRTGFLTWHFTVDDREAVQHLLTTEQGEHADYSGPGNRLSIGIEICEKRGMDQAGAIDRAARLAALMMKRHGIPIQNVVPHYHWPRHPNNWHKPCPRIMMDGGKPGAKWNAFVGQVYRYRRMLG